MFLFYVDAVVTRALLFFLLLSVLPKSRNRTETAHTAHPPWYKYPLLQLGGVLLAVVVIGVFLNQLIRHLMDLCCHRKDVTMTTTSVEHRSCSRTKSRCCPSWKLTDRRSSYVVNKLGSSIDDLVHATRTLDNSLGNTDNEETDYITMGVRPSKIGIFCNCITVFYKQSNQLCIWTA